MLFNSQIFLLAFLPLALGFYHLAGATSFQRRVILLVFSFAFYCYWDYRFAPILALSILFNWAVAYMAGRSLSVRAAGWIAVLFNLALLGFFKYYNFAIENLSAATGVSFDTVSVILPLGISFFTFQQISYLVDVSRQQAPKYGLLDYAVYISFFPQLIAGPIVRHQLFMPQIDGIARIDDLPRKLSQGAAFLVIGLVKKTLFADQLATFSDPVFQRFADGGAVSTPDAWIAILAFSGQIYFDFSGYSDMAIGLALMFGFGLPFNFEAPYRSVSIRDFWRRWHITLGSFLRDYLYIPMGGNRGGLFTQSLVLLGTMLLAGLWHGAAWTFVFWGALHGLALAANRLWHKMGLRLPELIAIAVTFLFVTLAWVPFRAADFAATGKMYQTLFAPENLTVSAFENLWILPLALAVAILGPTSQKFVFDSMRPNRLLSAALSVVLVVCILNVGGKFSYDFVYFQF